MISAYGESSDSGIRNMTFQMKLKFEKYWGNIESLNLLVFVAFILYPRHKLHYVEFMIGEFYDQERVDKLCTSVDVAMRSWFSAYNQEKNAKDVGSDNSVIASSQDTSGHEQILDDQQRLKMKFKKIIGTSSGQERKSEFDKYLADECEPDNDDFDILGWWRNTQKRYPILAMIARDVLAIPVSTIASESAISTGGRVLDSFRASLTPRIVEALVCAQDWLRGGNNCLSVEEDILDLEELEEG